MAIATKTNNASLYNFKHNSTQNKDIVSSTKKAYRALSSTENTTTSTHFNLNKRIQKQRILSSNIYTKNGIDYKVNFSLEQTDKGNFKNPLHIAILDKIYLKL